MHLLHDAYLFLKAFRLKREGLDKSGLDSINRPTMAFALFAAAIWDLTFLHQIMWLYLHPFAATASHFCYKFVIVFEQIRHNLRIEYGYTVIRRGLSRIIYFFSFVYSLDN